MRGNRTASWSEVFSGLGEPFDKDQEHLSGYNVIGVREGNGYFCNASFSSLFCLTRSR